ncbi:hypothetical protein [Wohlfahrtiimonas larvae]|uniref:N-acetyltransferase domain-containing protein n=1 Tax=Wohlfahrtiimonas larvae TaxID=1157986 RepID=A0ABP9MKR7_9GAMM|nr:hypothetical protein [Wohlfahrtiimonas larvae]
MNIIFEPMKENDLSQITQLLHKHSASENGGLLGDFTEEKVQIMVKTSFSVIVARNNDAIIGVVFSFPMTGSDLPPLVAQINHQFPNLVKHNWLYGPVCIDENFRGGTILQSLFDKICRENRGKPIAFINNDNIRSIRAHAKLGMVRIADFDFQDTSYILVSTL